MKTKVDINANKISKIMAEKSLPAYRLAGLAGLSRQTVSAALHSGTCSMFTAVKLANGLGITFDELTAKEAPEKCQEPEPLDELIKEFINKFLEYLGKGKKNENQWEQIN